jgi:hypothetical protein
MEQFKAETHALATMCLEKPRVILGRGIAKLPIDVGKTIPSVENMARTVRG